MSALQHLITEHIDIWTAADTGKKSGRGRASSNAGSVYGIKKLRELILELAVRGKLVPQDANDEPASELLKRIQAEKAKLVAEGTIKKEKTHTNISEADLNFTKPKGWEFVSISTITLLITDGTHHTPKYQDKGVPFISVKDINGQTISFDDCKYLTQEEHEQINLRCNPERDDILLCRIGTLGRATIVDTDIAFSLFVSVGLLKMPKSIKFAKYLHLTLSSPLMYSQFDTIKAGGSHTNKLNLGEIPRLSVPIPPLAEQHRIVAKVDELMALCDQLETQHSYAADAHEKLVSHLLSTLTQSQDAADFNTNWQRIATHFDTLFTTEASIDTLKQTVLQLAVMGKLVPQDPSDEPASELLKKYNIPFNPGKNLGWSESALGKLGTIYGGATPSKANPEYWDGDIPWIAPKDMKRPYIENGEDTISQSAVDETSLKLIPVGSLLMVVRGMILAHSFPVAITRVVVTINQDMKAIAIPSEMKEYVLLYLQAKKHAFVALVDRSSHGTCKLLSEKLWNAPIAIPPESEQKHIIAKVRELMTLCEQLKSRITDACQCQQKLADVLVTNTV